MFQIDFSCSNCGNKWFEVFTSGVEVKQDSLGVFVHPDNCNGCPCTGRRIICTVCARQNDIRITSREPLKSTKIPV